MESTRARASLPPEPVVALVVEPIVEPAAAHPFFAVQRRHVDLCRTRSAACR